MKDVILNYIKFLSVDIGKRGSCTANEKKAREFVFKKLQDFNIKEVYEDLFLAPPTFTWTYLILFSLPLIAIVINFLGLSWLAFIISILGLVLFFLETQTFTFLHNLLPQKESGNILALIPAKENLKNQVVFVAHLDSSKAGFVFSPNQVKHFRKTFLGNLISYCAITFLLFTGAFYRFFPWWLHLPFSLFLFFTLIMLLHRELFYTHTNGANDNAAGSGIILALANYFSKNPLKNTQITFLFTGAEEVGLFGMLDFLKKRGKDYKYAYFFNFDNCGIGTPKFSTVEGLIFPSDVPMDLQQIANQAADLLQNKVQSFNFRTMLTDASACLARKYKAISILATDENNLLPHWHWVTDTFDKIQGETVETCFNFGIAVAKIVDDK